MYKTVWLHQHTHQLLQFNKLMLGVCNTLEDGSMGLTTATAAVWQEPLQQWPSLALRQLCREAIKKYSAVWYLQLDACAPQQSDVARSTV